MVQCLLTINIQQFLYTVIKFKVVNQGILNRLQCFLYVWTYHFSIDFFKDTIRYCIVNSVQRPLNRGF